MGESNVFLSNSIRRTSDMRCSLTGLLAILCLTATSASKLDLHSPRGLTGTARVESVDTTNLICQVGQKNSDPIAVAQTFEINYFYALGTTQELTNLEQHKIDQALFAAVQDNISWCYQETSASTFSNASTSNGNGGRTLSPEARARELGIMSVSSGQAQMNVGGCPVAVNDLINSTGATACRGVESVVRVNAHNVDNVDFMSAAILDALEDAINVKKVWQGWQHVAGLAFIYYLGDTYEQVYGDVPPLVPIVPDSNGDGNESVPPLDPVVPDSDGDGDESSDGSTGALLLLVGVGVPVAAGLVVLALIASRRRRSTMTSRELQDMLNSDFVLVGTGDPPGSFHEGLYHYMKNGTRYLSTNCEGCLETRRNSFYTDQNLGTIMEDHEYQENILVCADSKDLGRLSSTMDVHKCSSGTCGRCLPYSRCGRTMFLPSSKQTLPMYPVSEHIEV